MNENRRHHDEAAPDHDALARLLRAADPAAGDAGLNPVERARMRQAITETADQHAASGLWTGGWQGWMKPALAAAAVIIVVGLAVGTFGRNPEDPPGEVADAGVTAPEPPTSVANPVPGTMPESSETPELITALDPVTDPVSAAVDPTTPPNPEPATTAATPVSSPESTAVAIVDDPSPPDKQARTMQFTAPRGTRIIWTLDPNFESPIAEREARQEQAQ